jgi:hypothetical protein
MNQVNKKKFAKKCMAMMSRLEYCITERGTALKWMRREQHICKHPKAAVSLNLYRPAAAYLPDNSN